MGVEVNYFAILLAVVANMATGMLWYSPMLFAKPWMKAMGYTASSMKDDQKEMGKWYGISAILGGVMAYVLSHVMALSMNFFGTDPVTTGLTSAFWMWLGFIMPVQATTTIFSREKNWNLFGINTGYQLVSMLLMGLVLGLLH